MESSNLYLATQDSEPPLTLDGLNVREREAIERFLAAVEAADRAGEGKISGNYLAKELKQLWEAGMIGAHICYSANKIGDLNHELIPAMQKLFLTIGRVFTYRGDQIAGISELGRRIYRAFRPLFSQCR